MVRDQITNLLEERNISIGDYRYLLCNILKYMSRIEMLTNNNEEKLYSPTHIELLSLNVKELIGYYSSALPLMNVSISI
jgi:hypothetical protein